jgi:hypothetical protein
MRVVLMAIRFERGTEPNKKTVIARNGATKQSLGITEAQKDCRALLSTFTAPPISDPGGLAMRVPLMSIRFERRTEPNKKTVIARSEANRTK